MKFLFDLFPVILFFITLKIAEKTASASLVLSKTLGFFGIAVNVKPDLVPIMLATVVVIVASLLQIIWVKLRHGKVDKTLWFSAGLVTVLGSMTLYFQNANFIKWKPTILYWAFFVTLIASELIFKNNIIKSMVGKEMQLPNAIWKKLNLAWAVFFLGLGCLNLYVAFHYSTDTWASFKLFGTMGLMFAFVIAQSLVLNKYIVEEKTSTKDNQ
ncbi:MAG: septation protein A [Methylophilaceae bacterium]|nr:septation protein A [Methylophilaceae bacterium]